jgi:DNA-binding response OmpR family regulator
MSAKRALIVDDNALIRDIIDRTLKARGFDTVQAENAIAGWKSIDNPMPELAVIDVMLPGEMDGVGLCKLMRNDPRCKDMVIVMITASDKKREADRSIAAGADILIGKPFSPKQFWNQVDSLIKDRRVQ